MARPQDDLVVKIKIGGGGTTYVDVTANVKSMSWTRGRDRTTDDFQPGHGQLLLQDDDRRFDPNNPAGPYYTGLTPRRQMQILWDGNELFTGFVTGWSVDYLPGDNIEYVPVNFVDAFGIFARIDLNEITAAFNGDTSGERVDRVLALADSTAFLAGDNVDTGLSTLGTTTYGENSLSYLQRVAAAEAGYLFIDMAGVFQFLDRATTLNLVSNFEFTDQRNVANQIPYQRVTQTSNDELLYNQATGRSATTGTDQTINAPTSQASYYISTLTIGELLNSADAEVENLLQWNVQRFKDPEARFSSIELQVLGLSATGSPSQLDKVLLLELTTAVTVNRTPLGVGTPISKMCIIEGVSHDITNDSWTVTFALTNADTRTFLVLDDPVFGELDKYRVAF